MKQQITKFLVLGLAIITSVSGTFVASRAATASAVNSNDTACVYRTFNNGNLNQTCVASIQKMLNKVSNARLTVDSDFGPKTDAAVRNWQNKFNETYKAQGVHLTVDGIVGPSTWLSLCTQRNLYKPTAKSVGCARWNNEITLFQKLTGKDASTTKPAKGTKTACVKQTFSYTKSNKDSICMQYLQNMLNIATGSTLDTTAAYSKTTRNAVKAFQNNHSVANESAGVVGKRTWAKLCTYSAPNDHIRSVYGQLKAKAGCDHVVG